MSKIKGGGFKMMSGNFYTPGYFDWFCNLRFQNRYTYAYQYYGVFEYRETWFIVTKPFLFPAHERDSVYSSRQVNTLVVRGGKTSSFGVTLTKDTIQKSISENMKLQRSGRSKHWNILMIGRLVKSYAYICIL